MESRELDSENSFADQRDIWSKIGDARQLTPRSGKYFLPAGNKNITRCSECTIEALNSLKISSRERKDDRP